MRYKVRVGLCNPQRLEIAVDWMYKLGFSFKGEKDKEWYIEEIRKAHKPLGFVWLYMRQDTKQVSWSTINLSASGHIELKSVGEFINICQNPKEVNI